jgi:hypothetical protein
MEHAAIPDEFDVMSGVDFIVPLKQVGIITRSVLEAIQRFYRPRRIIVVTKKIEVDILKKLTPYWDVGVVEYMDEAVFFVRNFGLSFEDIIAEYDAARPGQNRIRSPCILLHLFQTDCVMPPVVHGRTVSSSYIIFVFKAISVKPDGGYSN